MNTVVVGVGGYIPRSQTEGIPVSLVQADVPLFTRVFAVQYATERTPSGTATPSRSPIAAASRSLTARRTPIENSFPEAFRNVCSFVNMASVSEEDSTSKGSESMKAGTFQLA